VDWQEVLISSETLYATYRQAILKFKYGIDIPFFILRPPSANWRMRGRFG
jgi:hypothetical protein